MSNVLIFGNSNFRTSTSQRHSDTKDHRFSVLAKSENKGLEQSIAKQVSYHHSAVCLAINTVYWLAKENIAKGKVLFIVTVVRKTGLSEC